MFGGGWGYAGSVMGLGSELRTANFGVVVYPGVGCKISVVLNNVVQNRGIVLTSCLPFQHGLFHFVVAHHTYVLRI